MVQTEILKNNEFLITSESNSKNICEFRGLTKVFGSTVALSDVSFEIPKGTVHGVVGENGAGKSTLINIIGGSIPCDDGVMIIDGKALSPRTPLEARDAGISVVHQEFPQCEHMTVGENLFLSPKPLGGRGLLSKSKIIQYAQDALNRAKIELNASDKVESLTVGQKQLVEIARAVSLGAKLVIMDEPTSALTELEAGLLFKIIENLRKGGISIIYVSHRMREIFELCDTVSVLRDGCHVETSKINDFTPSKVVSLMVGREVDTFYPSRQRPNENYTLQVKNLTSDGHFSNVTLGARGGEILGIAGLPGSGHQSLMRALFGESKDLSGSIELDGVARNWNSPELAIRDKIGYVPSDRRLDGAALDLSVEENIGMLQHRTSGFIVNRRKMRAIVENSIKKLGVKVSNISHPLRSLSGGNQQKAIIAKWLTISPRILILDDPTRGIDVGAKAEVYRILSDFAREGGTVLLASTELPELLALSNRIAVFYNGMVHTVFDGEIHDEKQVMAAMTGTQI